jgi:hypothetical protein
MKTKIISIRVTEELKQKLERISELTGQSHSQLIRPLIEEKLIEPEIIDLGEGRYYNTKTDHELINSLGFMELLFWIYDKKFEPRADEIDEFYEYLIKTIEKVKQSQLFTMPFKDAMTEIGKELRISLEDESFHQFDFPNNDELYEYILRSDVNMIRWYTDQELLIPFTD